MRCVVLGAGMVGRAAVFDFARNNDVVSVIVIDREIERARAVAERYGNGKTEALALDVADTVALDALLERVDIALGAVSYRVNERLTERCIAKGVHFLDLGGNNDVVERQFALSPRAKEAGVTIVPDCGIAPGMVSILAARLLELRPSATGIYLRVGGLPLEPRTPWNYQVVFSTEGLVNEYKESVVCLRDGELVTLPSLDELEFVQFPEPFGRLEAFTTSGGASTLPSTFMGRVANLDYKTLRYPGHCQLVQALFALGFADDGPVDIDGVSVVPRRFLERQFDTHLIASGPDVILATAEARGPDGSTLLRLIDKADTETGLSAMARCTAFSATAIAHMIGTSVINERGTLHQELSIPAEAFIEAIRLRGLELTEE